MAAIYFDTHKYINTLKAAGVSEVQAEAMSAANTEAFSTLGDDQLATKADIKDLRKDIQDIRLILAKHDGEFTLLKWMQGFVIAGILSLVLKAFFL